MIVVVASMSHVGKKPREATIFGFTSVVQIAKWLLHSFSLEAVFLLGFWQGFCRSQWRSTWKSSAKEPLSVVLLAIHPYKPMYISVRFEQCKSWITFFYPYDQHVLIHLTGNQELAASHNPTPKF
jgi:hypothetical protein